MTDPLVARIARKFLDNPQKKEALVERVAQRFVDRQIAHRIAMKFFNGTETYAHAQDLESFVKDLPKFLKDPNAHVDDSWRR
jgi:hypothetical protein